MDKYHPIKCAHYDHIELACIRQRALSVELMCGEKVTGKAINVEASANKCEWLTIETSSQLRKIRLDKIVVIRHQQEGIAPLALK
ncbi:transcriptional antiterminator [Shewanella sp. OPT22]|nr:transcriptional antiterminator [Shewanella sp. OPT22]